MPGQTTAANKGRKQEKRRANSQTRTHTREHTYTHSHWQRKELSRLTDHMIGDVDLDLSFRLESHLAFDALIRLLLQEKTQDWNSHFF